MKLGYSFHPEAEVDIVDIWDFIANDSPDTADRVTDDIVNRIDGLVKFPHQGHRRIDLTARSLLFVRIYEYLIAYAPDEEPLWLWQLCMAAGVPA